MQANCDKEYLRSVRLALEIYLHTFEKIQGGLKYLAKDLKLEKKDAIFKKTNKLLNDVISATTVFGSNVPMERPVSNVLTEKSDVYKQYFTMLLDFDNFLNNVVSVLKLK